MGKFGPWSGMTESEWRLARAGERVALMPLGGADKRGTIIGTHCHGHTIRWDSGGVSVLTLAQAGTVRALVPKPKRIA